MFKAEMLLAGLVTGLNLGERAIILVANKTDLVRFKTSMSNLSSPRARAVTGKRCSHSGQIAIPKKIDFWSQISKFWGQNCTFTFLAAHFNLADQYF